METGRLNIYVLCLCFALVVNWLIVVIEIQRDIKKDYKLIKAKNN